MKKSTHQTVIHPTWLCNTHSKLILFLSLFVLTSTKSFAQSTGTGADGSAFVTTTITTDDTRAAVTDIVFNASDVDITVDAGAMYGSWSAIAGKKVLIIIMAKTGASPTRNWQIMTVNSWDNINKKLTVNMFPHTNWPSGSLNVSDCKMQVIEVKQYTSITIDNGGVVTCAPWDGNTGGVVAFLANTGLTINNGGWIDVAQKGFFNVNNGGFGGNAGGGGSAPSPQPPVDGNDGYNGNGYEFDARSLGQPIIPLPNISGGNGGTGGLKVKGEWGWPGGERGTRLNLLPPQPPKILVPGNAGAQGRGGRGGDGGGSGGNGGNGAMSVGGLGTTGTSGGGTYNGGQGGNGGTGGGVVIILANSISIPHSSQCIDISGSSGSMGSNGTGIGGQAGDGGNGGDGECGPNYIGYGGMGIKGQRGNGSAGGDGGGGGSIGSFSIRCISPNVNPIVKTTHVKYQKGTGMPGGLGMPPYSTPANDGVDGNLNDPSLCPPFNGTPGVKRVYEIFNCAALEAYRVLADMDWAQDRGYYIEYRKSNGQGTCKKSPYNRFAMQDTDYYCLYFKCSKVIMAFEPADTNPIPIMRLNPLTGYNGPAYFEQKHNIYWAKLDDPSSIPGTTCLSVHQSFQTDINASLISLPPFTSIAATGFYGTPSRQHDFGFVDFGSGIGGVHKYRYYDLPSYTQLGSGFVGFNAAGAFGCQKACVDTLFRWEWVIMAGCGRPSETEGGVGVFPSYGVYEVPPRIPYDPALWDNPDNGKDGENGQDGDEDDSYFEGGDVGSGGDYEPEAPVYSGLQEITNKGTYVTLTPNPAGQEIYLNFSEHHTGGVIQIKVADITGKVLLTQQQNSKKGQVESINIQQLSPGTYFMQVSSKSFTEMLKFVKH